LRILRLPTVDSTNLEAKRLVEQGERGPLWIVSEEQTAGKGRLGRQWVSKPGNFYGTLLWPTDAPQMKISQLSFVAALAVHATASDFASTNELSLKWPNDCLLDGAKFCGILCEGIGDGLVALGIGINIAHVPDHLPYRASKLSNATVESVFEKLRLNISNSLSIWNDGSGFDTIRRQWMACCSHVGQQVNVDGIPGKFTGLAADGSLLLQTERGETKQFYAGDVKVGYQAKP